MKTVLIVLALLTLALAWVGYRMDTDWIGPARVGTWVAATAFVTLAVLALLRRA